MFFTIFPCKKKKSRLNQKEIDRKQRIILAFYHPNSRFCYQKHISSNKIFLENKKNLEINDKVINSKDYMRIRRMLAESNELSRFYKISNL